MRAMRPTTIISRLLPLRPATVVTTTPFLIPAVGYNSRLMTRRCLASLALSNASPDDVAQVMGLEGEEGMVTRKKRKSRKKDLEGGVVGVEDGERSMLGMKIDPAGITVAPLKKKKKKAKKVVEEMKEGGEVEEAEEMLPLVATKKGGRRTPTRAKSQSSDAEQIVSQHTTMDKPIGKKKKKKATTVEEEESTPAAPLDKLILRDYQQECIDAVLEHIDMGYKRVGISLATGAGKTVVFTQLIDAIPARGERGTQTLILVHRRELVQQALKHCQRHYPEKRIEVEMANQVASGDADITLASVQSIVSKDRLAKFDPEKFKLILIDECHHAVSSVYLKTLDHFGAKDPDPGNNHPIVVGVSATMERHDGASLGAIMDYLVFHRDYVDMIRDKHLTDVKFTTVHTEADLSQVRTTGGDYNISDLAIAVNTDATNEVTVRAWLEKARKPDDPDNFRHSTLVFCVDIAHVHAMANTFRKHGIDARLVTSLSSTEERAQLLKEFKNREFPVLVNCGIFTEGTDIPNIDCVLLARPTKSKNLLIQMIGRGMRLYPGKTSCHVIDMVGIITKGIVSTPTLFGLDPSALLDNATPESLDKLAEKEETAEVMVADTVPDLTQNMRELTIKSVAFTDYDSIYDLMEDTSHDKYIRQMSPYAWVKIGADDYVLSSNSGVLRIERAGDNTYTVSECSGSTWSSFLQQWVKKKPQILAESVQGLDHAVRGADTFATANYTQNIIKHNTAWRKEPATEAQMKQLYKIQPDGDWERKKVTKGQAADIQTRIKYGRAKWEKVLKMGQKVREKVERESLAGSKLGGGRQEIRVGPMS